MTKVEILNEHKKTMDVLYNLTYNSITKETKGLPVKDNLMKMIDLIAGEYEFIEKQKNSELNADNTTTH